MPDEAQLSPTERLAARWNAADEAAGADGPGVEETHPEPEHDAMAEEAVGMEPESTEDATEPAEDEQTETFSTLSDLLEAGGVQADQLTASVTIDGAEVQVPLAEALAGYRRDADYTRKTQALADERRAFEAERAQQAERLGSVVADADAIEGVINEVFTQELQAVQGRYNGVDWNQLRQDNPAEFAAAYAQQQAEIQSVQQRHRGALADVQAKRQKAQAEMVNLRAETLAKERARMLERIPSWSDPTVAEREGGEIAGYLMQRYGASPQEVSNIIDHRLTDLARKAMLYDRLQEEAPKVAEKARTGTLRPGARRPRVPASTKAQTDTRERLAKTHRMEDAEAALKARWG